MERKVKDAVAHIVALARADRVEQAERELVALLEAADGPPDHLRDVADALGATAREVAHTIATDGDRAAYAWLRARTMRLWYAWGAQATSGGDGLARRDEIEAAADALHHTDRIAGVPA